MRFARAVVGAASTMRRSRAEMAVTFGGGSAVYAAGLGRLRLLLGAAAVGALTAPGVVRAQGEAWSPGRPIRLVVPYPPGGATDILARLVAQRLGDRFGQSIVIDNRPGANGIVASRYVLSSPADGLTFL